MSPPPSEATGFDPFAVLGLAARFDVDPAAVRAAYRVRAANLHPDRASDAAERVSLARASAELAEAQRILLDPVRRGEAILAAHGGAVTSGPPSGEFLVEMMELREAIDAAAGDPAALATLRIGIEDRVAQAVDRLGSTLADLAERPAAGRSGGCRIAADTLGLLRYLQRLRDATEEAAGGGDASGVRP